LALVSFAASHKAKAYQLGESVHFCPSHGMFRSGLWISCWTNCSPIEQNCATPIHSNGLLLQLGLVKSQVSFLHSKSPPFVHRDLKSMNVAWLTWMMQLRWNASKQASLQHGGSTRGKLTCRWSWISTSMPSFATLVWHRHALVLMQGRWIVNDTVWAPVQRFHWHHVAIRRWWALALGCEAGSFSFW